MRFAMSQKYIADLGQANSDIAFLVTASAFVFAP